MHIRVNSLFMTNIFSNATITRKDRLRDLKARETSYFDLGFIKAIPPEHRSACIDLLDQSKSQLRQDLFALSKLNFIKGGFFVEFGATNGVELNNTWLMETAFDWTGILAEPARNWQADLVANRKCAIEKLCVWRASSETLKFTEAPRGVNSAISSFVKKSRKLRGTTYDVTTISLNDLLSKHGAPDVIDYMSVDTEGSEFDILNAVDFDRWSFRIMTVEHNYAPQRENIYNLLTSKGYVRVLEDVSRFDDWYVKPD
ncbi:methyltransferase FkbM domain protein [Pseudosulfitobacter pseudonitzschiae]|uniref:Methyltransferase FkbM domain protein n=2 Tax=Pseudosulfitobacter pseudonitzschiae TaxID=1402135 RepID=A0A221K0H2_9RHOB|nr:methyltransferase FkbM domain protein [Pseudosulfitobacter pseudonitzschiae]